VAPRTRLYTFGSAGVLVIAGAIVWPVVGGVTGQVLAIAFWLLGFGGALLLLFLEVGLSEDRELEREEAIRRAREAKREEVRRRLRMPRRPRRPS
jgi:uncharacterized membrane protein